MRKLLLAFAALVALASPALADFTGKDASAATITFKNASGACSSVVCVPQSAITDSTGANYVAVLTVGADGASNTANGLLGYSRNLVFNGTTWDRWTGAVTISGGATSALQTTGNTSLSTIATNSGTQATAANQTTGNTSAAATATASGTPTDTPCTAPASATSCTMEALLKALLNVGQYPAGAVAITASATGTTVATTATLAAAVGKTTYICSYSIRANATSATTVVNTYTGIITGTLSHQMWVAPAASGMGIDEGIYNPCVPASATNTGIAGVSGAPGAGGGVSVALTGYQL